VNRFFLPTNSGFGSLKAKYGKRAKAPTAKEPIANG
jgi:hypothetical protein